MKHLSKKLIALILSSTSIMAMEPEHPKMTESKTVTLDKKELNYQLGHQFMEGIPEEGIIADPKKAYHYLELAANDGHSQAQYELSDHYMFGAGNNQILGIYWLNKSAEKDHPKALFDLGNMYFNGTINDKNITLALEYLQRAANKNSLEAINNTSRV